jgi:hypothetical protein
MVSSVELQIQYVQSEVIFVCISLTTHNNKECYVPYMNQGWFSYKIRNSWMAPTSGKFVKYGLSFNVYITQTESKLVHQLCMGLHNVFHRNWCDSVGAEPCMHSLLLHVSHLYSGDVNAVLDIVKCVSCSQSLYSCFQVSVAGHDVH